MDKILFLVISLIFSTMASAQRLSLDSCRAMALRSNKPLSIARVKKDVATNARKAARTLYLPHVDLNGGYMYSSREISLLSDEQKYVLSNMGTIGMQQISANASASPALAQVMQSSLGQTMQALAPTIEQAANAVGEKIVEAFRTNTHHIFTASAMVTQPIYMGGAITAGNNLADIAEKMAATSIEAKEHDVLYDIDNAYWTVVSLRHKQVLAESYLSLVQQLDDDVHKMIKEGVATRADGLKVDVAVNEADMTKTKVDNGLALAKMYLCQLCGIDLNSNITLADEDGEVITSTLLPENNRTPEDISATLQEQRPELQMLANAIEMSKEQVKLARAGYLPQVAFMGGAIFTNPSVYNGFERKFKGALNVGIMVKVPVLDWGETMYKIRAAKCTSNIAQLSYDEAEEMMQLQVNQCNFKVREANKNLVTARKNISRAEENLRCANLGFKEGVMQTTDVMAAQTAWMQAQTMKIDAEIEVKMSETALKKALGNM